MHQILVYGDSLTWGIVAVEEHCRFFDAGKVTTSSIVDGVHLDADQHATLGHELAKAVGSFL